MTKNDLKIALESSTVNEKYEIYQAEKSSYSKNDLYNVLIDLLHHENGQTRFFSLFNLINDFSDKLMKCNDDLIDVFISLLIDIEAPVVDRAAWAISIIGENALLKLIEVAWSSNSNLRSKAIWAISRNKNINLHKHKVIEVLLGGLRDENEDIQVSSMFSLMDISPRRKNLNYTLKDVNFDSIYQEVKPLAKRLSVSEIEHLNYWGSYYLEIIESDI